MIDNSNVHSPENNAIIDRISLLIGINDISKFYIHIFNNNVEICKQNYF